MRRSMRRQKLHDTWVTYPKSNVYILNVSVFDGRITLRIGGANKPIL